MQPRKLSPILSAALGCLVVMGAGAFYFITTPSQNIQLILSSLAIIACVLAIFYFNWRLSHPNIKRAEPQRRLTLTAQSNLEHQVRLLESDLDNLTGIVKDLAETLESVQKTIDSLAKVNHLKEPTVSVDTRDELVIKPDASLFLRPIVLLNNQSIKFYEALLPKKDNNTTDYLWKINSSLQLLSKLKAKSPELKLVTSYPFDKLNDKRLINALLLQRTLLPSLILEVEGIENIEFNQNLIDQMRILKRLGVGFAINNVGTILQNSRLKTISNFNEMGVVMVRQPATKMRDESFVKNDIDRLTQANIAFVVDNIDDSVNIVEIKAFGVLYGQGPTLGAARPVKNDIINQNTNIAITQSYKDSETRKTA